MLPPMLGGQSMPRPSLQRRLPRQIFSVYLARKFVMADIRKIFIMLQNKQEIPQFVFENTGRPRIPQTAAARTLRGRRCAARAARPLPELKG